MEYVRTYYVRTYNVMSQLSDWKRAHMCTENHVCFGRVHGSQLREGANAGQHTPTLPLPPSHHCLHGEVYRGNRHYNVRTYVHVYNIMAQKRTCVRSTRVRTGVPGVPPRRRLSDPGVLQGTVTPRRRAQGGDAGSGSYPSLRACDIVVAIPAVDLAIEAVV